MSRIALVLIVLIALPLSGQVAGQAGPATARQTPRGECLAPERLFDQDGDVTRNRAALASRDLCLRLEVFTASSMRESEG